MSTRKTVLTSDQHRSLADRLYLLYNQVLFLSDDLQFIGKNHKLVKALGKAGDGLGSVRSELEEVFFRDHHNEFDAHVYYPGGESEVVRFTKSCNWRDVEVVIQDSLTKLVAIANELLPAVTVTSRLWKSAEKAQHALEDASGKLATLRMKECT